eukprot:2108997-Pyramimonas_sp.AAC.1
MEETGAGLSAAERISALSEEDKTEYAPVYYLCRPSTHLSTTSVDRVAMDVERLRVQEDKARLLDMGHDLDIASSGYGYARRAGPQAPQAPRWCKRWRDGRIVEGQFGTAGMEDQFAIEEIDEEGECCSTSPCFCRHPRTYMDTP